jgi:CopG family nickel-responsive transcriptional regulator
VIGKGSGLVRFGVAMEADLLERFDDLIARRRYPNRSEAIRDLVRHELDDYAWETGGKIVATVTLIYDHHVRELTERLTAIQHEFGAAIVSALHVHLDHDHCMEVIAVRGAASQIQELSERLLGSKGVFSGGVTAAALPAGGPQHSRSSGHAHGHHEDGHRHPHEPRPGSPPEKAKAPHRKKRAAP